jgi:hypothetical protein
MRDTCNIKMNLTILNWTIIIHDDQQDAAFFDSFIFNIAASQQQFGWQNPKL